MHPTPSKFQLCSRSTSHHPLSTCSPRARSPNLSALNHVPGIRSCRDVHQIQDALAGLRIRAHGSET
eukprot:2225500-Rhodomonas_salina.2